MCIHAAAAALNLEMPHSEDTPSTILRRLKVKQPRSGRSEPKSHNPKGTQEKRVVVGHLGSLRTVLLVAIGGSY